MPYPTIFETGSVQSATHFVSLTWLFVFIRISVYVNKSIAQIILAVKHSLSELFGSCVRELRIGTGLSQVEFGEMCGFYQTYLSRIENGKANPTLNAIEVIANALGMTVFELFDRVKAHQLPAAKKRN